MRAVRIHENGGPEVLRLDDVDVPEPGPGQARVRVEAAGLNFIDVYQREGRYPMDLPVTLGVEAAGVVDAVGDDVDEVGAGDRVAWAMRPGTYAEYAVVDAWLIAPVPDAVDLPVAAAAMLQGTTAHYLVTSTYPLGDDDTALVHAAAGGVGHLLTQLAKARGARVIATASTEEKAELAWGDGADEVIRYTEEDFAEATRRLTDGRGVDVVYDGVGQATFTDGLAVLRPRGMMVLYGGASGPVPPFDPQELNRRGSLFLTRPTLGDYLADRDELLWRTGEVFGAVEAGELDVRIDQRFPLDGTADAHRYLEGRRTKGKVLLVP